MGWEPEGEKIDRSRSTEICNLDSRKKFIYNIWTFTTFLRSERAIEIIDKEFLLLLSPQNVGNVTVIP
jgi:hypothetical protein